MKRWLLTLIFGLIFLFSIFFILFVSASSNLEINSSNYSGFFTSGLSNGNVTNSSFSGEGSFFYQQAIGYLNDFLVSGIHGFTSQISTPTASIVKPANATYITVTGLPLNFTLDSSVNYIWYNLDNGANTTIFGNTTFNTTNGLHTLYLFVNNSEETTSKNITFTANTDKFIIHYNNYSGSTKGQSTNFNESTYEELQNLSEIILENTNFGKIAFNTAINLTNDSNFADNSLDLNSYTTISNNSIDLNSTALPNFNKSATLYLYNLSFTNPRVLKDGEVCPSAICTEINYSGGTFVFNVTQFTNYSAEETPSGVAGTAGPGGGGGGVSTSTLFSIDKKQISVSLTPGQIKTEEVTIRNERNQKINIDIENLFKDFLIIQNSSFELNPKESKIMKIDFVAREDTIPDLYLGKLIVKSESQKEEILVAIEVESEGILLDVRAEILNKYKKVLPGEEVLAEMRLFNLGGDTDRKDVLIEYLIKDYEGNEIVKETESLAIQTQATFIKRVSIPEKTPVGNYILYVRAIYNEKVASSSDNFEVVSSTTTENEKLYISIAVILSIIIGWLIYHMIIKKSGDEKWS